MARRERRAYPQRSVRSEQRRQAAQSACALRVAPLLVLACVAPQSQTAEEEEGYRGGWWVGEQAGMLLRRLLGQNQNRQQRDPCQYFNRLLAVTMQLASGFWDSSWRLGNCIAVRKFGEELLPNRSPPWTVLEWDAQLDVSATLGMAQDAGSRKEPEAQGADRDLVQPA